MSNKSLFIEEIGDIHLVKSDKAKNLIISVKPLEPVKVTIPRRVSYQEAQLFINEKISWIKKNKLKLASLEEDYTIFDVDTKFQTKSHELELIPSLSNKIHSRISCGKIKVYYPLSKNIKDQEIQEAIRTAIKNALKKEAKAYLPQRLCYLSMQHQLAFNRVFVKSTKSTWGSCTPENNINLSIHLMRLPNELIDYVLLHELSHTIEKNHGKGFWRLMNLVTNGKAKELDKRMNQYQPHIF